MLKTPSDARTVAQYYLLARLCSPSDVQRSVRRVIGLGLKWTDFAPQIGIGSVSGLDDGGKLVSAPPASRTATHPRGFADVGRTGGTFQAEVTDPIRAKVERLAQYMGNEPQPDQGPNPTCPSRRSAPSVGGRSRVHNSRWRCQVQRAGLLLDQFTVGHLGGGLRRTSH